MNSTMVGDAFRDQVADLLRTAGYSTTTEILEGHKRVDGVFEQLVLGKRRRYALEAKNWKQPLDHSDLETIYGGYASLLQKRAIDELLIVSPHELHSPAAKAFVRDTSSITHLSFKQLQESVIGFQNYLATFVANHEADGLERYFVKPSFSDGTIAEKYIMEWVQQDAAGPVAIIASYGMGKTSFARHMTYKLATQFLSGTPARIPIFVSLGTIAREQSLEGLIGSVLAGGTPSVVNYNFPLFFRLNSMGRFVIFLDGFDEMKHMMTWSEFQSNFDELNRLVRDKAKVILLGRPTAFLSDDERRFVLRGTQRIGKVKHKTPGAPSYQEVILSSFTAAQIKQFIRAYLVHYQNSVDNESAADFIKRREREIDQLGQDALMSRPVHARMLADLATDPEFDITGMSRFTLYDHFFDHLVKREFKKPGRGPSYKPEDRRSFACDLAWYLWTSPGNSGIGCRLDDLPNSLFEPYRAVGDDLPSVKRALLSGSFLDEKSGGIYFFSHRSFQEFLVAEYIWNSVGDGSPQGMAGGSGPSVLDLVTEYLTRDVFDFLVERGDKPFFRDFITALNRGKGTIPLSFLRIIASSEIVREIAVSRSRTVFSSWDAAVLAAHLFSSDNLPESRQLENFASVINEKTDTRPMVRLSAIWLVVVMALIGKHDLNSVVTTIVSLLFSHADRYLSNLLSEATKVRSSDVMSNVIFECVSAEYEEAGSELSMTLDVEALLEALEPAPILSVSESDVVLPSETRIRLPFSKFFADVPQDYWGIILKFFESDANVARDIE
jgi:hypothetical protein